MYVLRPLAIFPETDRTIRSKLSKFVQLDIAPQCSNKHTRKAILCRHKTDVPSHSSHSCSRVGAGECVMGLWSSGKEIIKGLCDFAGSFPVDGLTFSVDPQL